MRPRQRSIPTHAPGNFDVKVQARSADSSQVNGSCLTRLSLAKQLQGDLDTVSQDERLAAGDGATSGACVALGKVAGTLHGQRGSFVLVHRSLPVDGGPQHWTVVVASGSGTDALGGISGSMQISMAGGKHADASSYILPAD